MLSWWVLLGTRLSEQDSVGDEWVNILKKITNNDFIFIEVNPRGKLVLIL